MIKISCYDYTEQRARVTFDNKRSYWYSMPEYWYRKLCSWIKNKNYNRVSRFLRGS